MSPLDYEQELRAFYDWLATNPMKPPAIALWHALMYIASISGWPDEFTIRQSLLESYTGLCRDAISTHRNTLKQKNRIDFRSQRGNQSCIYRIVPFVSFKTTQIPAQDFVSFKSAQTPAQAPVQTAVQMEVQPFVSFKTSQRPAQIPFVSENASLKTTQIPLYKGIYDDDGGGDDGFFDGDDLPARAREASPVEIGGESGGNVENRFSALDAYSGMTPKLKAEAAALADRLTRYYFGRPATEHDACRLFDCIRHTEQKPDGTWTARIDPDRAGVAEEAFKVASEDGVFKWRYVSQVLSRFARRGLRTAEDCENYQARHEFDKDNRR